MKIYWELNQQDFFSSLLTVKMLTLRLKKQQLLVLEISALSNNLSIWIISFVVSNFASQIL